MGGRLRDFRSEHTKNTPPTQELELLMKELDCAGDWCVVDYRCIPSDTVSFWLLPPANEVWGKVMFLHLCVILSQGGLHRGGRVGRPSLGTAGYCQ